MCPTYYTAMAIGFILCSLLEGCSRTDINTEVGSPKLRVTVDDSFLTFEGRWRTVSDTGARIPRLNTAEGLCVKPTMTCTENIAKLYGENEWPGQPRGILKVASTYFKIIEWSNARIVARYDAPVADIELRISLADTAAERSFRETKARGSQTADSKNAGHWILE